MHSKVLSAAMLVVLLGSATFGDDSREAVHGEDNPLDAAIDRVREGCGKVERLRDYSCTLVLRERVDGELYDYQYLRLKVRHHPFSIYAYWLKPQSLRGRELIYVEGQNDGKMLAHEGRGCSLLPYVALSPTGPLVMRGHRYPYTQMDLKSTLDRFTKLLEDVRSDAGWGVSWIEGGKINGRECTFLQLDSARPDTPFSRVRIWFDDELQLPVRFVKWEPLEEPDDDPELAEEYTFLQVERNVGLTDNDFDMSNPEYAFLRTAPRPQQETARPSSGIERGRGRIRCFLRSRRR